MDSSESSHPASASVSESRSLTPCTSNSGSHDSEEMSMSSSYPPSNSASRSTSTPPETQSSGTMNTTTPEEEEEDQVDTTSNDESTPIQEEDQQMNETELPTGNEHVEDDQSNSENRRGAEEIGLLTDLYAFYNRESHYSFIPKGNDTMHMQEFYNRQVQVYHAYATDQEVDDKLNELYENYIKVVENKVEFPTDPIDIQIFRQSSWIWDDAHIEDSENSSKQENAGVADDVMKELPKDSTKQETRDDHDDDMKDSKDLPDQETGDVDMKDNSQDFPKDDDHKAGGPNSAT